MRELIILGIGNRLMMDDGIGVHIVEELRKRDTNSGIRYVVGETDIYYCLEQIVDDSYVIIVDAAYLGEKPGTLSIIPLQQVSESPVKQISIHDSHLLNEIRLSSKIIDGVFIGVEPYEIDYSLNLSVALQSQFSEIADLVGRIIQHIFCDYPL